MSNRIVPKNTFRQNPRNQEFVGDPYYVYAQWHARQAPVYWEEYGFWCLYRYADVNRALRDRRFARLPPDTVAPPDIPAHLNDFGAAEKYSLLAMEPPEHTRLRKRVNRAFLSRQIGRMEPVIHAVAYACIDKFATTAQTELLQHYATPIAVNVITRVLGVPQEAGARLVAWSHAMVRVYTLTQTHEEELAANQAAAEFQAFLYQLIAQKRANPADDLLSHMLALRDDAMSISDEEIVSVTILLLNAGHEATVHQLGNAVSVLLTQYGAENRTQLLEALKDNGKADAIVAECLRFAAPLHLFTRYAQEALMLEGGIQLAPGEQIGLLLGAANRCPVQFSEPDRFIPDRTDAAHLSLGAGIHYCIGAHLARLELRIAMQVLFERLPELTLAETPRYKNAYHFHGLQNLHVRW